MGLIKRPPQYRLTTIVIALALGASWFSWRTWREPAAAVQPAGSKAGLAADDPVNTSLDRKVYVEFSGVPLERVLRRLVEAAGIRPQLSRESITDAGVALDEPIRQNFNGVSVRSALDTLLEPRGLDWVIRSGALVIDTRAKIRPSDAVPATPVGISPAK